MHAHKFMCVLEPAETTACDQMMAAQVIAVKAPAEILRCLDKSLLNEGRRRILHGSVVHGTACGTSMSYYMYSRSSRMR